MTDPGTGQLPDAGRSDRLHLSPRHREILETLLREHLPGIEVWAYGSRVNGESHDGSDLDLVLRAPGLQEVPIGPLADFTEALHDSTLPFLVEARDWARLPERFHKEIERGYVVLVEKEDMDDDWQTAAWGEIASLEYGKALRNYKSSTGPYRVFGTNGPIGWHDEMLCAHSSVIIGRKGAYRGVHYSARPFFVIDTAFYLKPKVEMDVRWAYYQLLNQDINGLDSGSAIPSTRREDFYSLPVKVPSLAEQYTIAHILGTLDDKIELNRRMNETLEALARALFKSWFVDFDPVRAKMEGRWSPGESLPGLPAHLYDLFPDRLVDSELGEVPEGWEVGTVDRLATVVGGATPSTKNTHYWKGGEHYWATPRDLAPLSTPVLLQTERKITDAGLGKISSGLLPRGTVLLSSRAPIGYLAIAEIPVAINQGFIGILPREGISNLFALYWSEASHEEITNYANGSTFLEISKGNFRCIPLVVPEKVVMVAFDRSIRPCYERIVSNEHESRGLVEVRETLLPKLVSGKLRVCSGLATKNDSPTSYNSKL